MNPKISILMSNYNDSRYIEVAIKSLINQTFINWELVLVDDGSSDESVKIIGRFLSDNRIRFYQNRQNIGRIKCMDKMINLAGAEIVGILDADDALEKTALDEILKIYNKKNDVGLVYSQSYYCNENLEKKHIGFSAKIPNGKSNLHLHLVHHFRTFKKNLFFRTTGYDESIITAEDFDIVLKLEEVAEFYFLDKPLYYYRVLSKSHSHGFKNTKINRSSTALAKLNAYKRRLGTDIPNLNKAEISEVLFWGIINAFLALRWKLVFRLKLNLLKIHPVFFLDFKFYKTVYKKIKKIKNLKQTKSLLKI